MTNFSVLRYVRIDVAVNKPVLRRAKTNMIYIRDREATNSIYSGYPTFYGIDGKFILYLDAKMAAPAPAPAAAPDDDAADAPDDAAAPADALAILDSEKIWIDFWKIPSEFNDLDGAPVAAVDTLQGDIASGWDAMILAATELEASPDIGGDIGIKLEAHGSRVYYDEFLPNSRVKNPNSIHAFKEYVLKTEVDGYQENRSPVSSLGLDDDKEFYVAEDYDPGFTTE